MKEFEEAVERIVAGLEKKNRLINASERRPWPTTRWDTPWSRCRSRH